MNNTDDYINTAVIVIHIFTDRKNHLYSFVD